MTGGATRYVTAGDATCGRVGRRLVTAGTIAAAAGVVALVAMRAGHVPGRVAVPSGAAVTALVAVIGALARRGLVAIVLRRAMVEVGLSHRRPDGTVDGPRRRGRVIHVGRNAVVRWSLPQRVTLKDVLDRTAALEQRCSVSLRCWFEDGLLHTEVLRHQIPRRVGFRHFYAQPRPAGRLLVGLGKGRRGALWCDLASLPHLLVGGMTGGGKSVFLRQALTHLALDHLPRNLRLVCVDLKGGVELDRFGRLPHALGQVATTVEGATAALGEVRAELDRRLEELRRAGCEDIDTWHAAGMPHLPRLLVVVDEVAELTTREVGADRGARETRQAATGRLCEIARLGRAAGVHLIVCTQRPDAEAVPGQLKANLPGTVAFRVRNATNSLILLDTDSAALLPPHPGRAIWAHESAEEFQAVDLSTQESRHLLDAKWGDPQAAAEPPMSAVTTEAALCR